MDKDIRMTITPVTSRTCQCNACYARNFGREMKDAIGRYDTHLYELQVGQLAITLCNACLRDLGIGAITVADGRIDDWKCDVSCRRGA